MPRKRKPLATQKGNLTVAQQEDKKLEERLVLTGRNPYQNRQLGSLMPGLKMNLKDL